MTTKIIIFFFFYSFYTSVNFLIYVFKNFFYVLFCSFNCFFGTNKSLLDRNLKTITCSMISTFPSYFASDATVRNFPKFWWNILLRFLGTCSTIPSFNTIATANLSCWFSFSDFNKISKAKGGKKSKQRLTVTFCSWGKGRTTKRSSGRVNSHAVLRNCRIHHAQVMFIVFRILNLG